MEQGLRSFTSDDSHSEGGTNLVYISTEVVYRGRPLQKCTINSPKHLSAPISISLQRERLVTVYSYGMLHVLIFVLRVANHPSLNNEVR